ncbi:MAG: sulfurtransferase TusA family protein [Nitrososphaerota archaeon]|nr:sulfurtransferase TusA family protein [Nitrososphaerota archaeon]
MTSAQVSSDKVLDARGLMCPMPVVKTGTAIKEIQVGQVLEVLATDPGSKPDLTAWAKMTGNELLLVEEVEGSPKVYRFKFRRTK